MGLSRRKFTREMKLAAVRQLENGSSVALQLNSLPERESPTLTRVEDFREASLGGSPKCARYRRY